MCDGSICLILLSLSKIPCNQYIHANADPDRCRIHQSCNGKRQGNRRQSIFTQLRYKRAVYQIIGILQKHGNQRRYRHLPDEFSNGLDRHFVIGLHAFPLFHKLSEQYSFVCVLWADRLPGPDSPMQSLRHHARFPLASTPAGDSCRFRCQKSPAYIWGL